jgi:ankyrin repeat protein
VLRLNRKLLEYCSDAPYVDVHARMCLHEAVLKNRIKFVEFILEESKLSKLINMQDNDGNTALHLDSSRVQYEDGWCITASPSHRHLCV